jgi:NDMA-dependent alcohol dehydrogenase
MQAAVLNEINTPFSIETVDLAEPKAGEVLIKVAAAGICHSDWHIVAGKADFPSPIILGHEGAGIVEAVGAGVARVQPGDHVTLSFRASCGECFYCQNDQASICENDLDEVIAGVLGDGSSRISWRGEPVYILAGLGAFAEYIVCREVSVVSVRKDVPLEVAALVGCAVSTGVGAAMFTAEVRAGQSVAVFGAGGVGLNIIQGAALCGADPIIAVDTSSNKMEIAREFGATHTLYSDDSTVGEIQAITGGRGADHVFESVGLSFLQERGLDATRPGGALTLVGLTPVGSDTNLPGAIITRTEKVIRGSFYGSVNANRDFPMFIELYRAGKLKLDELVTRRYRLDEINEAYANMLTGEVARGIIVF